MEDEYELQISPLSQKISSGGQTLQVDIYRGGDDGWILEVVDETGTSTVWDDLFPTDADALAYVTETISSGGIESLIGLEPGASD